MVDKPLRVTYPYAKRSGGQSAGGVFGHTRRRACDMPEIDHAYRKDTKHPQRWGYQLRGNAVPSSVIIHTTSNRRATRFETEAEYLQHSKDVSAHYLIGKDGRVTEFLDPLKYQAWHSGDTLPAYLNARSIGIEHHVSVGEAWTDAQHAASTWLVRQFISRFGISPLRIDTHRAVALPKGRKSDPEGWDDDSFYAWQDALGTPPPVSLPTDPFQAWGAIGKPEGIATGFAVPKAWLVNKVLGACVQPETYAHGGKYSITEFTNGIILYLKEKKSTQVVLF